ENHAETAEEILSLPVADGELRLAGDACKLAVVERHGRSGAKAIGIVSGAGFDRPAALAITVAHDSHNLMILGNSEPLMARAGNELAAAGGGILLLVDAPGGLERTILPLPLA